MTLSANCDVKNLSMPDYLSAEGLSSSALCYADSSMETYKAYLDGLLMLEKSESLSIGTALHALFECGYEEFFNHYIVKPKGIDRRTKKGKEDFTNFELSAGAKIIIDLDDMLRISKMYESIMNTRDDALRMLLNNRLLQKEVSHFWIENGLLCKCRPDVLIECDDDTSDLLSSRFPSLFTPTNKIKICLDVKTSSSPVSPTQWPWTVKRFSYDLKGAHYLAGTGADAFGWIAVESNPPYSSMLYFMGRGRANKMLERRRVLMEKIIMCNELGEWPGYECDFNQLLIEDK